MTILKYTLAAAMLSGIGLNSMAWADMEVPDVPRLITPTVDNRVLIDSLKPMRDNRHPDGYTLRCWHDGRLLYDGTGFSGQSQGGSNMIQLAQQNGDSVKVFDLQDGMCIMSRINP